MAEAQFQPAQTDPAGQFFRAAEFGQNFMQRRQRQQWEAEDREIVAQQRALAAPVVQSKLMADQASSLATLETFRQQQQLKTRFAAEAPIANEEFQKALALPTFQEQERALAILQPKYAWMQMIPDGKGFVDTLNNSRAQAFQYSLTDQKIKAEMNAITARNAAELEQIRTRGREARETAGVVASERRATNAALPERPDPARRDAERIRYLKDQADAIRSFDPETAALFEQRAAYLANPAGAGGSDDPFAAWTGGATATSTAPASPAAPAPAPVAPVATDTQTVIDSIRF